MKKIIISETQEKILAKSIRQMINESQESKSIDAAKKLLISKGYTPEQADKFVRIDLRNDIPSLRNPKNAKFILGVTRMFLNRELSDATIILNIDRTIEFLALAHYNEYDRNLNGLSAEELINRFADARSEQSQEKRNALSVRQFEQRDYNIVKINSFEEASDYSNYTSWCITQDESAFNSYTADGEAQFYFCLKTGFENIEPIEDENCPLDEYGLSMIAVCVDCNGDLKTCTCRWNHDNGGNDSIMDEEQISNVVGVNFYQVFKPSNGLKEKIEALKGMTEIPRYYFKNSRIKKITIPNNIISIERGAFSGCKSLTSVTIPDSVIWIGDYAFAECNSLTSITIPNSVTEIGERAFSDCQFLTSITIPDSVTSIGECAFFHCASLTSVTIPDSITSIGEAPFYWCNSLPVIDGIQYAGAYLVKVVDKTRTSYTIKPGTRFIGTYAFSDCTSLTSITIPDSVTSIKNWAFRDCRSLTSIIIPDSVTWIGNYAFYKCASLTNITIPNSVTSIGYEVFYNCASLTSIRIPNRVKSIRDNAFQNCTSLTNVTIPIRFKDKIIRIFGDTNAKFNFYGQQNESLVKKTRRIFVTENQYKQFINEITIKDKYKKETQMGKNKLPYDVFEFVCNIDPTTKPNKVGKFANWLLAKYNENADWRRLKVAIEWYADGLKRGIITRNGISGDINTFKSYDELINAIDSLSNDSNSQMSNHEYNNREKLKGQYEIVGSTSMFDIIKPLTFDAERYFGSGTEWCTVANIQYFKTYMNLGQLFIVYPKNSDETLKMQFHIESESFADCEDNVYKSGVECIESVVTDENEGVSLISLCQKLFGKKYFITLKDKMEALKTMTEIPNGYFEDSKIKEIIIPDSITSIGKYAFKGCSSLTSVTIPDSVTSIGIAAFSNCESLTSITIPNGVISIGDGAFHYCISLTSITIPNGVTSIREDAFWNCSSLTSVKIPDSVTSIGDYTFCNCSNLTSVTIPDRVTSIGKSAFNGCSSLTSVTIGNSVTSIGYGAFSNCSSLPSVTIPDSVTSIEELAFYGWKSLKSVTIPDSVTSIGNSAFYECTSLTSVTMPIRFKYEINNIFGTINANAKFNFYGEESISSNNNIQENMSNKKIIITEQQECFLATILREETQQMPVNKKMNKPFCVNPEKVLIVKKFLDKGFSSHDYEKIGPDGFPKKIKVISMNASNGEPLKYMYQDQLHDLLIDKFQNMFADKLERASFLKQVIKDWLNNSITIFGGLSTNEILAENMTSEEVDIEASEANPNPTEGQKEASNYKMGHVVVMGMPISIETAKGNFRRYRNEDGTEGKNEMKNHYGYFKNTSGNGKDGDAVDVFIGPDIENCDMVYVVDQNNKKNEFDESKVMLGFKSIKDAKKAYLSNYSKDWKGFRDITGVSLSIFKKWLYRKHKQRKPFAEYVLIKKNKV